MKLNIANDELFLIRLTLIFTYEYTSFSFLRNLNYI